jgi:2-C-methyl-D-erythritol 4-phosphate cytidylyltransferase
MNRTSSTSPKTPMNAAAAVVVAAGSSTRMGFDKPTALLAGRPLLHWSLAAIEECSDISAAILVVAPHRLDEFTNLAKPFLKIHRVVAGGSERSASVLNGLLALAENPPALVAVHDAARPLATAPLFSQVLAAAAKHRAASAAHPVTDSLHRASPDGLLHTTIPRENLFAMETPQAARFPDLLAALQTHGPSATDEVGALIAAGIHPFPVLHGAPNFKITRPADLTTAEALLKGVSQKFLTA